mgnify:CR=1 FL=1
MRILSLLLAFAVLAGCGEQNSSGASQQTSAERHDPVVREAKRGLHQSIAVLRKKQIANPSYELSVVLNAEGTPFSGSLLARFDFAAQGSDLTLDFSGGEVLEVLLNGKAEPFEYNGHFLTFKENHFIEGQNELAITYRREYSKEGSGLYYFKDPLDDTVYTYSDLEPFYANMIFPLFDQPNLKAKYTITVDAPSHWVVVSNMKEKEVVPAGDRSVWKFPPSPLMSSYVVSIHAGDYASFDLGEYEGIPLRLFSRQSNKAFVPVEEWNTVTRQGFAFFNDFFGIAYPFGKYDQLAVPDFNSGAMENVGAVTFADQYCCVDGERSLSHKTFFLNSILHEQAHMWFGNLVTMDWWNDIWLNESFAEFAGYLALAGGTDFESPWLENLWARKLWGYRDDDAISTHPIKFPVENTEYVMSAIDGITYAKGSAVLRQLSYYLGEETFKKGVQAYMKKYAYKNARFEDLLNELSIAADRPMDDWAHDWLKTSGVNRVATKLSCEDSKIKNLELIQSSKGDKLQLRAQNFKLALYSAVDGKLQAPSIFEVEMKDEATTIAAATGQPCPSIILPNFGDYGYMKVVLDSDSRKNLNAYLGQVEDPHARALFWVALWDGVVDGRYSVSDYLDVVLSQASSESNLQILNGIRSGLVQAQNWLFKMEGDAARDIQKQYSEKVEAMALAGLKSSDPNGDDFQIWLTIYRNVTYLPEHLDQLHAWLKQDRVESWTLDQRTRWLFLAILAERNYSGVAELIEEEKRNDTSARGHRLYLSAKTRLANADEKLKIFAEVIHRDSTDSLGNRRSAVRALDPLRQPKIHREIAKKIIEQVVDNADEISTEMMLEFTRNNLPGYYECEESWGDYIDSVLDKKSISHKPLRNVLLESQESNSRCVKAKNVLFPAG